MKNIRKITALPVGSLFVLVGLIFYYTKYYSYQFILVEQTQFFLFTTGFFTSYLEKAGGICEYIAAFFVQFYQVKVYGTVIISLTAVSLWFLMNKLLVPFRLKPFTWLHPSVVCFATVWLLHTYIHYPLSKSIALAVVYLFAFLYIQIKSNRWRIISGLIFAFLSWYVCKEASFILLFYILGYERTTERFLFKHSYFLCICLIFLLLPLFLRFILNPFHVEEIVGLQNRNQEWAVGYYLLYGWLPFFILFTGLIQKQGVLYGITVIASLVLIYIGCAKTADYKLERLQEIDWLSRQEKWNTIIEKTKDLTLTDSDVLNYYYLALAKTGKMNNDLFDQGFPFVESLLCPKATSYVDKTRLSNVYWETGCFRASQLCSTEAGVLLELGTNAFHLKRLAMIHMIYNEPALAEKYLRILKNTFLHRAWAVEQLNNLQDNKLLDQVDFVREKRKLLLFRQFTIKTSHPAVNIERMAIQSRESEVASQYMYSLMLLQKRLTDYYMMISLFKPAQLSEIMQEAILVYEHFRQIPDTQKLKINYSKDVLTRYTMYVKMCRFHPLVSDMSPSIYNFKKSYFYYYAFINVEK